MARRGLPIPARWAIAVYLALALTTVVWGWAIYEWVGMLGGGPCEESVLEKGSREAVLISCPLGPERNYTLQVRDSQGRDLGELWWGHNRPPCLLAWRGEDLLEVTVPFEDEEVLKVGGVIVRIQTELGCRPSKYPPWPAS